MQHEFPFFSLLLITALATLLPFLTSALPRLRMPLVVVEILAGMVIGRSGFQLIEIGPVLEFLAIFGFTYLMFLSGLEMDYHALTLADNDRTQGTYAGRPLFVGVMSFLMTLTGALLIATGLRAMGLIQHPFIIGLILSTTSLDIAVSVLKERGLTTTRYGQTILISAVVADFGAMLLITIAAAVMSHGLTLNVLLVFLLVAVFAAVVRVGRLAIGIPGLQAVVEELTHTTAQIQVRATFALMVGFIVVSKWLGTEIILGAFLAGTVIALLTGREGSLLHVKMDAIGYGFFIPIFFIMVGVRFDLSVFQRAPEALFLVPLLLVSAYVVKLVPALLFRLHFSWRQTVAAGMLLSSRLSMIIAAASIALGLGMITEAVNAAVVLLALITCTLSPVLFSYVLPGETAPMRHGLILVGLGQLPTMLAERLRQTGERVTLVGSDRTRVARIKQRGLTVVEGNPIQPETLRTAGADMAAALIAIGSSDEDNLAVCRLAAETFGIPNLIALANDPAVAGHMSREGIRVVQPQLATALAMEGALHFPATFDMLVNAAEGVTVREVVLCNQRLNGLPLRHVHLPGDTLVLGLRRDGEVLIPHGDTVLRLGDVLMLVSSPEDLQKAVAWIDPHSV
jgi:Kef-type K+ transport system membrane component KefB/Trk K+ transport system NAD-binding subunit